MSKTTGSLNLEILINSLFYCFVTWRYHIIKTPTKDFAGGKRLFISRRLVNKLTHSYAYKFQKYFQMDLLHKPFYMVFLLGNIL